MPSIFSEVYTMTISQIPTTHSPLASPRGRLEEGIKKIAENHLDKSPDTFAKTMKLLAGGLPPIARDVVLDASKCMKNLDWKRHMLSSRKEYYQKSCVEVIPKKPGEPIVQLSQRPLTEDPKKTIAVAAKSKGVFPFIPTKKDLDKMVLELCNKKKYLLGLDNTEEKCYCRAYEVAKVLLGMGIPETCLSNLFLDYEGRCISEYNWKYHVAVCVTLPNREKWVIDPALSSEALEISRWIELQKLQPLSHAVTVVYPKEKPIDVIRAVGCVYRNFFWQEREKISKEMVDYSHIPREEKLLEDLILRLSIKKEV